MEVAVMQCNRCGKSYPIRSMLADSSGKGLICQKCYEVISQVRSDADKLVKKKISPEIIQRGFRKREGKEYICRLCNYRFISQSKVKRCPYCGEQEGLMVMEELTKEIDDLLNR